ncbi:hypothetical protein BKA63DRAFT_565155 [Paraphoma chrysanthemicola]|nr:hypothetical protein BKA63DRAFT_565155 [Paraphoma chrysanthemicola]
MSAQGYYQGGQAPQYPQQSYGPPQGQYQQGPPMQYGAPPPQMQYGPPQGQYQQAPPPKQKKDRGSMAMQREMSVWNHRICYSLIIDRAVWALPQEGLPVSVDIL